MKSPKIKPPKPPPKPPQIDETLEQIRDYDQITRRRRGAAATILTGGTGLPDLGTVKKKKAQGGGPQPSA